MMTSKAEVGGEFESSYLITAEEFRVAEIRYKLYRMQQEHKIKDDNDR